MGKVEERLKELGYEIPTLPKPAAAYVPAVRSGNMVYISGQIVMVDGKLAMKGQVGVELTVEEGYKCAEICALNALAALKQEIGDLDRVKRIVKVVGFVNSPSGFDKQPQVINGFSEMMDKAFGEKGHHARAAVSACGLPLGTPVEVEMIAEVEED